MNGVRNLMRDTRLAVLQFAEVMKPELRRLPDPETRKLRALITRRNRVYVPDWPRSFAA